ncbi:MAG TPA: isoprenylcysteine carboxylmethyltransferase family protein [Solirubrobacterales bacterium]|nr:isoprenylcysteine carboxylmethyltransferase family protein [Solirubrobacterales bacterium]
MNAKDTAGVPAPPPLIYLAVFLVGLGLELAFPVDGPAAWVRVLGAAVGLAGFLALDGAATRAFLRARTSPIPFKPTTAIVTTGWPYGYTRNPMYLGMILLYCGFAFGFGVIWAFATLPLAIIAIDRLVIAREEPYLERKFGEPYREYKTRVRRWL